MGYYLNYKHFFKNSDIYNKTIMDKLHNVNKFLNSNHEVGEEVCDLNSGVCYIKTADGLIERKIIEKKLIVEDGRELLREETPISHTKRAFLR
jgi:predicted RNase H-like nuclease